LHPAPRIKTKLIIQISFLTTALIVVISYIAFEHLETSSKTMVARERSAAVSLLAYDIGNRLMPCASHHRITGNRGKVNA